MTHTALREISAGELRAELRRRKRERVTAAGAALRSERQAAGMSITEAAEIAAITAPHLSRAERGLRGVSPEVRSALRQAYRARQRAGVIAA